VITIHNYAFRSCPGITSVSIPSTATSIWDSAFSSCPNLVSIDMPVSNSKYQTVDGVLVYIEQLPEKVYLEAFPCAKTTNYTIPSNITRLGFGAFTDCTSLSFVSVPSSVTIFDHYSFDGCSNLEYLVYEGTTNPCYYSDTFRNCNKLKKICLPAAYQDSKFCYLSGYCKSDTCQQTLGEENQCYEFSNCVLQMRANASNWELRTTACKLYECINDTGGRSTDLCVKYNEHPKCYQSQCEYSTSIHDYQCFNTSLYSGNLTGCVERIECGDDGWKEFTKDCMAEILANPSTSKYINSATTDCYNFNCTNGGVCVATPHDECGKVCDAFAEECSSANQTTKLCRVYTGCSEVLSNGVWEAKCEYEPTDGWQELKDQENQCFEVVCKEGEWTVKKRANASEWESKLEPSCYHFTCVNDSGNVTEDLCVMNNPYPQCYISECQIDGYCSNHSNYNGPYADSDNLCDPQVICEEDGWHEIMRNCTAEILSDPNTPADINNDTISCYSVECDPNYQMCRYTALSECGKLCTESKEEECIANLQWTEYNHYDGCSEHKFGNIWIADCLYSYIADEARNIQVTLSLAIITLIATFIFTFN